MHIWRSRVPELVYQMSYLWMELFGAYIESHLNNFKFPLHSLLELLQILGTSNFHEAFSSRKLVLFDTKYLEVNALMGILVDKSSGLSYFNKVCSLLPTYLSMLRFFSPKRNTQTNKHAYQEVSLGRR